jgi:hypothetical protein
MMRWLNDALIIHSVDCSVAESLFCDIFPLENVDGDQLKGHKTTTKAK